VLTARMKLAAVTMRGWSTPLLQAFQRVYVPPVRGRGVDPPTDSARGRKGFQRLEIFQLVYTKQ